MALSDSELAQHAFFQLERRDRVRIASGTGKEDGMSLPADLLGAAEMYADRAWTILESMGQGYNPRAHARGLAEEAVIKYIRFRLVGVDPDERPEFARSVQTWKNYAAQQA